MIQPDSQLLRRADAPDELTASELGRVRDYNAAVLVFTIGMMVVLAGHALMRKFKPQWLPLFAIVEWVWLAALPYSLLMLRCPRCRRHLLSQMLRSRSNQSPAACENCGATLDAMIM